MLKMVIARQGFFFFFFPKALPSSTYEDLWNHIEPIQIIQENLPILKPADEQDQFYLQP